MSEEDIEKLLSAVEQTGRAEVDLEAQTIKSGNYVVPFTIDPARKTRLLNGWDELDLTAQHKDKIAAFAAKDRAERPWAVPRCFLILRWPPAALKEASTQCAAILRDARCARSSG